MLLCVAAHSECRFILAVAFKSHSTSHSAFPVRASVVACSIRLVLRRTTAASARRPPINSSSQPRPRRATPPARLSFHLPSRPLLAVSRPARASSKRLVVLCCTPHRTYHIACALRTALNWRVLHALKNKLALSGRRGNVDIWFIASRLQGLPFTGYSPLEASYACLLLRPSLTNPPQFSILQAVNPTSHRKGPTHEGDFGAGKRILP